MPTDELGDSTADGLDEVIGTFTAVNRELEQLRDRLNELTSSATELREARESIQSATKDAVKRYEDAIIQAREFVAAAVHDHKSSLAAFLEATEAAATAHRVAEDDLLEQIRVDVLRSLDAGQVDLRDTASKLQATIDALRGPGRDLADVAKAFRQLDPEAMQQQISTLNQELKTVNEVAKRVRLQGLIAIALSALTLLGLVLLR